MDGVSMPYIPTSLWILAGAMTILILLAAFGFYIYWRKWAAELAGTGSSVASLDARKAILEKDIEALRLWIDDQKGELDRLGAEREDQERLRAVLADIEQQCAIKNQENQSLRNEVGELENQRHNLAQTLERMQREIGDLVAKKAEAQALESRLAELRSRLDEAQQTIRNLAELEIKLNGLLNEKISLERAVEDLRTAAESARTESNRFKSEATQVRAEFENIERELTRARKEKSESEVIIDTLRHEQIALEHSVERLENKIEELKPVFRFAQEEVEKKTQQARQAGVEAERIGGYLASLRTKHQDLQNDVGALNARKAALEQEILKMDSKLGSRREPEEDELAAYSDLLQKTPLCLQRDSFSGERDERDETILLQLVRNTLRQEGLIFAPPGSSMPSIRPLSAMTLILLQFSPEYQEQEKPSSRFGMRKSWECTGW